MFKIYTDKNENFECDIQVKNASLKNSIARLVVESSDGTNLIFNGEIKDGKCKVPIKKVKGLLEENTNGKLYLEVIVEDTYFKPWGDDFTVQEHTSVKVKINEEISPIKPSVTIKVTPITKKHPAIREIIEICNKFDVNKINLKSSKKEDFIQIIKEYFNNNVEYNKDKISILTQLLK